MKAQGVDGKTVSACELRVNRHEVKMLSSPPGTTGPPTTIQQGFDALMSVTKQKGIPVETRDFVSIGCVTEKWAKGLNKDAYAKPLVKTTCFTLQGGYMAMIFESEDHKQVEFEVVRESLDKSASRRR